MKTVAIVLAAGQGRRMGTDRPKQYLNLPGGAMLTQAVRTFLEHPAIDAVQVAIAAADHDAYHQATDHLTGKLLPVIVGGDTRQESVRLTLHSLRQLAPEQVLIHDGARPYVRPQLIAAVMDGLKRSPAVFPRRPVTDCLWYATVTDTVGYAVDRSQYFCAQTPQGFHYAAILAAHESQRHGAFADDASLAQHAGLDITVVDGDPENIKLTTMDDMRLLQRGATVTRTGQGFDVHAFGPGDRVRLCGVDVPHEQGLVGHSDADVGWHALTDAIYGAIGAGDIGEHFPPDDPRWQGCDSTLFLQDAVNRAAHAGYQIGNVDLTLVCERPKLAPHRAAMRTRTAQVCGVDVQQVSVKATTSEGLGFTGRGEGIAACAVASVSST